MSGLIHHRKPARSRAIVLAIALGVVLPGCDNLLEVETPGVVPSSAWDDPANVDLLVSAALGEFECMFPVYIRSTATIAHELIVSGITGVHQNWGARRQVLRNDTGACGDGIGFYNPLQDARYLADEGYRRVSAFTDAQVANRTAKLAALAAYSGYTYTLMGEGMCESAIDGGPLVGRAELLDIAHDMFTSAITHAQAAGDNSILNMARVGRARVLLNLGRGAEAVQDAIDVPEGFVRNATRSETDPRRYNSLAVTTHEQRNWSVHPAYHDLVVGAAPDPRVALRDHGVVGTDNQTPQWSPEKYATRSAPIPIARWAEAQLIIAEVEGGQAAVGAINRLRTAAGIPPFSSTDADEIGEQIREERRRELFLESHRLNDMIRWGLAFPTGLTHKGQPYEDATCVPLPDAERDNNPNIS